jgi:hypothetical protein
VTERRTINLYSDSYDAMLRMTKRMYDAGIPILAGTDATAGIMLHRELELEVRKRESRPQSIADCNFQCCPASEAGQMN